MRFSNTRSCTIDVPSAWVSKAVMGACRSVAKPGYGSA